MRELISLPLTGAVLSEYPGGPAEAARACGCGGVEALWGGEALSTEIPAGLCVGYHLTFWPDWLDFWRGDRDALRRKFGSEAAWRAFYGGAEGRDTLLALYRADLERAQALGALYVVFHVSDVSLEEGYTYRWLHTHREVLDAGAEAANLLLEGLAPKLLFLVENQWWPGFTFTDPAQTRRLLDAISYPNKGIMLDTGHLLNTGLCLNSQAEGAAYLHRMLDEHGALCRYIRGVHLHQSLSGAYVRAHTGAPPRHWRDEADYLKKFSESYAHILRIDTHSPWDDPEIAAVIRRIGPDYLVHELSAASRAEREERVAVQRRALGFERR